jgi:hypothetical protein
MSDCDDCEETKNYTPPNSPPRSDPVEIPPPPFDRRSMKELFRLTDEDYDLIIKRCEEQTGRKYVDRAL